MQSRNSHQACVFVCVCGGGGGGGGAMEMDLRIHIGLEDMYFQTSHRFVDCKRKQSHLTEHHYSVPS